MTHRPLPPVAVPFVTAPTYVVRADLTRLGQLPAHVRDAGPPTLVRLDDDAGRMLAHALGELRAAPDAVRAVDAMADPERLTAVARALAAALEREGDPRVRVDDAGWTFPWLGVQVGTEGALTVPGPAVDAPPGVAACAPDAAAWLASARIGPAPLVLDALALALQEDVVVMTREHARDGGRAAYLNVVAPSAWDPGAHAGSSFARLHEPVPHRAKLDAAAGMLVDALVTRGPINRFVWSLAPDGALGRHPRRSAPAVAVAPERLWYRVERQTTLPVPEADAFVFLIRVYVAPLPQVVADPERRATLAAAVASMDADLLAYKGLVGRRDALLGWLRGW